MTGRTTVSRVQLVVGAAVLRHGRLLAARRGPSDRHAGGWELPGGKVEPGEIPEWSLAREVGEELGCQVGVGERLGADVALGGGLRLRAYACRLLSGDPLPYEHDALRWLGPEELGEVGWLPADRTLVEGLRDRLLDGEQLPGGNVGGAVRIGSTVRRPTGPWTGAVHDLLRHLAGTGLPGVPRVLGRDARRREVLTYLPGQAHDPDDVTPPDEVLCEAAHWLRRYHRQVEAYRPQGAVHWRGVTRPLGPGEIVCHNDCGSYNWVVDDGRFVGMLDWDLAGPGVPLDDLAFLAWSGVPLYRDGDPAELARRIRLATDAYGGGADPVDPVDLARHAVARMTTAGDRIAAGQASGDPGMVALTRIGEPGRTRARVNTLCARLPALEAAVSLGPP